MEAPPLVCSTPAAPMGVPLILHKSSSGFSADWLWREGWPNMRSGFFFCVCFCLFVYISPILASIQCITLKNKQKKKRISPYESPLRSTLLSRHPKCPHVTGAPVCTSVEPSTPAHHSCGSEYCISHASKSAGRTVNSNVHLIISLSNQWLWIKSLLSPKQTNIFAFFFYIF